MKYLPLVRPKIKNAQNLLKFGRCDISNLDFDVKNLFF